MAGREWYLPPHVREIRHHQRERAEREREAERGPRKRKKRCAFCARKPDADEKVIISNTSRAFICHPCVNKAHAMIGA